MTRFSHHGIAFWIRSGLITAFVITIAIFTYTKTINFRGGPIITISTPQTGATLADSLVTIEGNVKNAIAVYINDGKIFTNEAGDFKEKLIVPEGYTIMKVSAEDRFHRTAEKRLEIVVRK